MLSAESPERYAKQIRQHGALFCVSAAGYESMANNIQETLRFLRQLSTVVDLYEADLNESGPADVP